MWAEFIAIWRKLRGWIRQEDEEVNKEESARLVIVSLLFFSLFACARTLFFLSD
jgi:hypothetical protein